VPVLSRSKVVVAAAAVVAVAAGGASAMLLRTPDSSASRLVLVRPGDPAVAAAEATRKVPGAATHRVTLTAAPTTVEVAGRQVRTWAFNGAVPGPTLRLVAGDVLQATVVNRLPENLSVHWHGVALRNDMDGVAGLTQQPILPGASFTYSFVVPEAGTFWYHPHTGLQLDRGLYGALVASERSAAQPTRDIPLLLDDWTDGLAGTPEQVLQRLGGQQVNHHHPSGSMTPGGNGVAGDAGDVAYPAYLVNGRSPDAAPVYPVQPGERVRLRLVNSAADTAFRVAVGGARMKVVASDAYPVEPVTVDALSIAMGERYDVEVVVPHAGSLPVVAVAEGKSGRALAVLRVGHAALPAVDVTPRELAGRVLSLSDLRSTDAVRLPAAEPDRTHVVRLTGGMASYSWGLEAPEEDDAPLPVRQGERLRLLITNATMMSHPVHVHGHTFQIGADGPRKDTVLVPPMGTVTLDLDADNPGRWMIHCHNAYHAATGMMSLFSYVR